MGRQRPASVTHAIEAQAALVAVRGVATLLTAFQRDELVLAWAERHPTAKAILADGGLSALYDSALAPPAFVPVAIVSFVTFALLAAVLVMFFREGHHSARVSLTGLAVFFLLAMVALYRQDPPAVFVALAAVSAVLDALLLWFLWHPETNAFMRGAELAAHRED